MRQHHLLLFILTLLMAVPAAAQGDSSLEALQADMYKYFTTNEREKFFDITERLKELASQQGDEQTYYKAWGNQAIYESTHQQRNHAVEIAKDMKAHAMEQGSNFGQYTAIHVMASVCYQMQDYDTAERSLLEAIDYLHATQPGESAAADYLELVKIANQRGQLEKGMKYTRQVLSEPGLSPNHEIRALSSLCQYAALLGNRDEFNQYYERWNRLRLTTTAGTLAKNIEVYNCLMNGRYEEGLKLADGAEAQYRDELKATLYHAMGDDTNAYRHLKAHKQLSDSLNRQKAVGLLSDYMVQLNEERLESERLALEKEAQRLRELYWLTLGLIVLALLAYITYRRYHMVRQLRQQNKTLDQERKAESAAKEEAQKAQKDAEHALDVKNEFISNISRQMRTPLNPITGFSDILATSDFELGPEERSVMSQHIKENSQLLTGIIDSMIELSYYESKQTLPREDRISPNVIASKLMDELRVKCKEGVQLSMTTQVLDSTTLMTDMQSLEKLLYLLLESALNYTEKGRVELHCAETDTTVCFDVTDTGARITEEQRATVFEPLGRNSGSIKSSGMGLSICRSITKLLGGRIWLDETYASGNRFVVELPKG